MIECFAEDFVPSGAPAGGIDSPLAAQDRIYPFESPPLQPAPGPDLIKEGDKSAPSPSGGGTLSSSPKSSRSKVLPVIGGVAGACFILVIAAVTILWLWRRCAAVPDAKTPEQQRAPMPPDIMTNQGNEPQLVCRPAVEHHFAFDSHGSVN
jgi:hypothetical protein